MNKLSSWRIYDEKSNRAFSRSISVWIRRYSQKELKIYRVFGWVENSELKFQLDKWKTPRDVCNNSGFNSSVGWLPRAGIMICVIDIYFMYFYFVSFATSAGFSKFSSFKSNYKFFWHKVLKLENVGNWSERSRVRSWDFIFVNIGALIFSTFNDKFNKTVSRTAANTMLMINCFYIIIFKFTNFFNCIVQRRVFSEVKK